MKKIIMYLCIISLTCGAGTDVSAAPTLNEIISSAATATLENARANNTGIEVSLLQALTMTREYSPTGTTPSNISYILSSMRAQGEYYYSYNNDGYGIKTQSCSAGMFADSQYGLSSLLTNLRTYTKDISCISTGKAFAVTAKMKAGEYWCVDSAGNSKGITKHLKKGSVSCTAGVKISSKPVTETFGVTTTVFPTLSGTDIKQVYIGDGSSLYNLTRVQKSGVTYFQTTKEIDNEVSRNNKGLYVGRYVEIPPGSYIHEYLKLSMDPAKFVNSLLDPYVSSVVFLRTNADKSSVYQVSIPYTAIGGKSYYINGAADVKVLVTIKNGLITSVSSNTVIPSDSSTKVGFTLKSKIVPNTLTAQLQGRTISCADYFDEDEYCSAEALKMSVDRSKEDRERAVVSSTLSNMRAQAELYYSNYNSYGSSARNCSEGMFAATENGGLATLVNAAKNYSPNFLYCASNGQEWVVSAELPTGGYFCVDSNGRAKETSIKAEYADMSCK